MKKLLILIFMLLISASAFAETQSGNNQCRGLTDPGSVVFPVPFATAPTSVSCTPAAFLGETCKVLAVFTNHFDFECVTPTGQHKVGPMKWTASN